MTRETITPEILDSMMDRLRPATPRIYSSAREIARRIHVSEGFVRKVLAKEAGSPVRRIGGRYFAVEDELLSFFQPKPE